MNLSLIMPYMVITYGMLLLFSSANCSTEDAKAENPSSSASTSGDQNAKQSPVHPALKTLYGARDAVKKHVEAAHKVVMPAVNKYFDKYFKPNAIKVGETATRGFLNFRRKFLRPTVNNVVEGSHALGERLSSLKKWESSDDEKSDKDNKDKGSEKTGEEEKKKEGNKETKKVEEEKIDEQQNEHEKKVGQEKHEGKTEEGKKYEGKNEEIKHEEKKENKEKKESNNEEIKLIGEQLKALSLVKSAEINEDIESHTAEEQETKLRRKKGKMISEEHSEADKKMEMEQEIDWELFDSPNKNGKAFHLSLDMDEIADDEEEYEEEDDSSSSSSAAHSISEEVEPSSEQQ